jgi:hypothetical protein
MRGTPRDTRPCVSWSVAASDPERWLETDEIALVRQLGYLPGNAVAVAARSTHFPQLPDIERETVPIVNPTLPDCDT